MFNMANKCARAEEGRLSLLELPDADPEDKKTKTKDTKRKGPAILEAEIKRSCNHHESSKGKRSFCAFHNVYSHNTSDCQELRALRDGRLGRRPRAMIKATVAEVAEAEAAGTDATLVRSGATSRVRIAGRTSLARATGGSSLVRIDPRAMQPCLLCLHHQEGLKIITKTRGLGASRSLEPSPASWAAHKPQLPTMSSSNLCAR